MSTLTFWKVEVTEYERGWGQRPWATRFFDKLPDAEAYVAQNNAHNTAPTVPDWYVAATRPIPVNIPEELAELIIKRHASQNRGQNSKKRKTVRKRSTGNSNSK